MARRRAMNWMPLAIGAAALWFLFGRGKKAAAAPTTTPTPPPVLIERAGADAESAEEEAAWVTAATELWLAGVLTDDGRVVEYVEGVTHDPIDGAPIAVHGETMESYTDRALGWQQATGQQVLLPF